MEWPCAMSSGSGGSTSSSHRKAFRAAGNESIGDMAKRDNDPQAMMRTIAAKMSDAQIKAVASFVSGLSANEGGAEE